ncbi:hypothetical protein CDG81_13085 [Actinopolyspora erythraea]|uniref:Uncharacterized protein n=1 Tax=Actinopolyspora erythraea TaxID=414996 RepID=A0A099D739_9ACTN|nr:hypothetical protein CDG81_13085 [Actinopolyspora erythraea]KGI81190.1 hypothetical protein IL38_13195 [Actinopolyspora erythraea]
MPGGSSDLAPHPDGTHDFAAPRRRPARRLRGLVDRQRSRTDTVPVLSTFELVVLGGAPFG